MEHLSLLMKHIIADIQNLDVLLDDLARNNDLNNQFYLIMQFLEYASSRFSSFMENRKYFKDINCKNCMKCRCIGYDSIPENIQDIIANTESLHQEVLKIKSDVTTSSVQEKTYINHFILWIEYFMNEFFSITCNKNIDFSDYLCLDLLCLKKKHVWNK